MPTIMELFNQFENERNAQIAALDQQNHAQQLQRDAAAKAAAARTELLRAIEAADKRPPETTEDE